MKNFSYLFDCLNFVGNFLQKFNILLFKHHFSFGLKTFSCKTEKFENNSKNISFYLLKKNPDKKKEIPSNTKNQIY